jgi:hypothetical protein
MRLLNIGAIEEANAFLPEFMKKYNDKFGQNPVCVEDAHIIFTESEEVLDLILSTSCERMVTKNLEISYKNQIFQIKNQGKGRRILQKALVEVREQHTGEIAILFGEKSLEYQCIPQDRKPTIIVDVKEIEAVMDDIVEQRKKNTSNENEPIASIVK